MKPIRTLALAAAVSALATGVSASTFFTVKLDSLTGLGNVKVDSAPEGNGYPKNVNTAAFNMSSTDTNAPGFLSSFVAWCLDLGGIVSPGSSYSYQVTETPFTNSGIAPTTNPLSNEQLGRVQSIFDANYTNVLVSLSDSDANERKLAAAGFQTALWEAIYEVDGLTFFDLAQNLFQASDASVSGAIARAESYLGAAASWTSGQRWNLTYLQAESGSVQNLVTATVIPLPATGFLMLSVMGLGGIGVMARRRRDKAA